jgi:hypothetical protein
LCLALQMVLLASAESDLHSVPEMQVTIVILCLAGPIVLVILFVCRDIYLLRTGRSIFKQRSTTLSTDPSLVTPGSSGATSTAPRHGSGTSTALVLTIVTLVALLGSPAAGVAAAPPEQGIDATTAMPPRPSEIIDAGAAIWSPTLTGPSGSTPVSSVTVNTTADAVTAIEALVAAVGAGTPGQHFESTLTVPDSVVIDMEGAAITVPENATPYIAGSSSSSVLLNSTVHVQRGAYLGVEGLVLEYMHIRDRQGSQVRFHETVFNQSTLVGGHDLVCSYCHWHHHFDN